MILFKILKAQADELRWKVRQILEKSKSSKPNISKVERQAIKLLQDDDNIIILPEDKGNATVVMDRVKYSTWLAMVVIKELTMKMKRMLSQIFSKNKDLIPQMKYRQLTQHYSKLPHIYGLLKMHKDGIPLRPIVRKRGSVHWVISLWKSSAH